MINKFKEWSKNHKYEQTTDNAFLDFNFQAWQAGYEFAKEEHYETKIYSGEDLPPANTPVLALVIDHEDPLLVGYCDEERKWYFHDRCEYFDCDTYVQRWCYLPDFSKKETAKNDETLTCNHCNISVDYHPWHHSIGDNPHVHLCNECHEKHVNKWVSIKNKTPKKGQEVIYCRDGSVSGGVYYAKKYRKKGHEWQNDEGLGWEIQQNDYWQPLPEPPKE